MSLRWHTYSWKDLSKKTLYDILALRAEVFVVEQDCVYLDPDRKDKEALHIVAYETENLVAYARIFLNQNPCIIGRVVVHPAYRRKSIGRELMEKSIHEVPSAKPICISAQAQQKKFYESLGFSQTDKGYLEDGIPHIPMILLPRIANDS